MLEGAQGVREVVMIPAPNIDISDAQGQDLFVEDDETAQNFWLTDVLPHPGYFAAGAMAGAVSRTCTAPLDRLKVYLIANIDGAKSPVEAVKKGNALKAAKHFGQPLINATKELWAAGGMRSLFAGKQFPLWYQCLTNVNRQWVKCFESHARVRDQIRVF
jgi:solute carrier family 25 phosphate transporter 23/24/25/41